jgi:hypothetical protein
MKICKCCGQTIPNKYRHESLKDWLKTCPSEVTDARPVRTEVVREAYNDWARDNGAPEYSAIKLGLYLVDAIPGTYGKQMRIGGGQRERFYIFPKNPLSAFQSDVDDLLDI